LGKGLGKMSAGKMTFRWVSGIAQKQASWFVGSLQGKAAYAAWVVFLVQGFRDNGFLLQFEQTSDPWARARLVGEKIHQLREAFAKLTPEEKEALGKTGEVELRAGIELLSADKKRVMELVSIVDPPVPP